MAFKLTKQEAIQKQELATAIRLGHEKLEKSVADFNETLNSLVAVIEQEIDSYTQTLLNAREFIDDIVSSRQEEFNTKSDGWQEGEKGQQVEAWIEEWEGFDLDDPEIELPEELAIDLPDPDDFENLPASYTDLDK